MVLPQPSNVTSRQKSILNRSKKSILNKSNLTIFAALCAVVGLFLILLSNVLLLPLAVTSGGSASGKAAFLAKARPQSADLADPSPPANRADGTNLGRIRTQGSRHTTVMGMAVGYSISTYRTFVGSLRRSGFEGHIILAIAPDPKPGVLEYLTSKNVTAVRLEFADCDFDPGGGGKAQAMDGGKSSGHKVEAMTCARPYTDMMVRWSRYPLLRDYLEACEGCTGPVLVSDVRDTFFQRDPFGTGAPEVLGLQVFREHRSMTTANWIVQQIALSCTGLNFGEEPYLAPMLCSGTTVGTRETMLRYLTIMYEEMRVWLDNPSCDHRWVGDQAIHNYLFYTGRFHNAVAVPNRMGIVHTPGVQGSMLLEEHAKDMIEKTGKDRLVIMNTIPYQGANGKDQWIGPQFDLIDKEGFLVDFNGERSRVVHQFDRLGLPFGNYLRNKQGKLWKHLYGPDD
mmetsp:Transcript_26763/g.53377  ORF Transcript_26763/g.53377 Transcript_26763/m.53377 type:complete len:454 (-) Transcript_26763:38-1399(-)